MEDFQLGIIGNWRGKFALMSDEAFYDEENGWKWQIYKENLTELQLEAAFAAVKARMKLPIKDIRNAYRAKANEWKEAVKPARRKLAEETCRAEIARVIKNTNSKREIIRTKDAKNRWLFIINKGAENEFTIGIGNDNTLRGINLATEDYRAQTGDYVPEHIYDYIHEQLFIHSTELKECHLKVVE